MFAIKYGGGEAKKYLATTIPSQTKLTATSKIAGATATIDFFISKVDAEQLPYLKNYVIVVNENHVPESPTDGKIFFTIAKEEK